MIFNLSAHRNQILSKKTFKYEKFILIFTFSSLVSLNTLTNIVISIQQISSLQLKLNNIIDRQPNDQSSITKLLSLYNEVIFSNTKGSASSTQTNTFNPPFRLGFIGWKEIVVSCFSIRNAIFDQSS